VKNLTFYNDTESVIATVYNFGKSSKKIEHGVNAPKHSTRTFKIQSNSAIKLFFLANVNSVIHWKIENDAVLEDSGIIYLNTESIKEKDGQLTVKADSYTKLLEYAITRDREYENITLSNLVKDILEKAGFDNYNIELDGILTHSEDYVISFVYVPHGDYAFGKFPISITAGENGVYHFLYRGDELNNINQQLQTTVKDGFEINSDVVKNSFVSRLKNVGLEELNVSPIEYYGEVEYLNKYFAKFRYSDKALVGEFKTGISDDLFISIAVGSKSIDLKKYTSGLVTTVQSGLFFEGPNNYLFDFLYGANEYPATGAFLHLKGWEKNSLCFSYSRYLDSYQDLFTAVSFKSALDANFTNTSSSQDLNLKNINEGSYGDPAVGFNERFQMKELKTVFDGVKKHVYFIICVTRRRYSLERKYRYMLFKFTAVRDISAWEDLTHDIIELDSIELDYDEHFDIDTLYEIDGKFNAVKYNGSAYVHVVFTDFLDNDEINTGTDSEDVVLTTSSSTRHCHAAYNAARDEWLFVIEGSSDGNVAYTKSKKIYSFLESYQCGRTAIESLVDLCKMFNCVFVSNNDEVTFKSRDKYFSSEPVFQVTNYHDYSEELIPKKFDYIKLNSADDSITYPELTDVFIEDNNLNGLDISIKSTVTNSFLNFLAKRIFENYQDYPAVINVKSNLAAHPEFKAVSTLDVLNINGKNHVVFEIDVNDDTGEVILKLLRESDAS
jgi:hypothetical protein